MDVRLLVICSALFGLVALGGCGDEGSDWTEHSDPARGYSIELPDSWQLATKRMSRISDPRELFSAGTVAMEWRRTNCDAFAGAAGVSMGPADVVVTVWERGYDHHATWSDFPARPAAFGPVGNGEPADSECGEPVGTRTHWRNFSDAGRHFHTLVRVGPDASPASEAEGWRVLDRLHLDREYQPDWRASG